MTQALRIRARSVSMFSMRAKRFAALTVALLCAANLHLLGAVVAERGDEWTNLLQRGQRRDWDDEPRHNAPG